MTPRGAQEAPRAPQEAPRRPQGPKTAPSEPKKAPRWPQDGSKTPPRLPKTAPRRPHDTKGGRCEATKIYRFSGRQKRYIFLAWGWLPGRPQDAPKTPQDPPRRLPTAPRWPQDGKNDLAHVCSSLPSQSDLKLYQNWSEIGPELIRNWSQDGPKTAP